MEATNKKPDKKPDKKLLNKILTLLKGKTVRESTDILFAVMDKMKQETIV